MKEVIYEGSKKESVYVDGVAGGGGGDRDIERGVFAEVYAGSRNASCGGSGRNADGDPNGAGEAL